MDEKERSRTLALTLSQIEKQFGKGSVLRLGAKEAIVPVSTISSGSISLDYALGAGEGHGTYILSPRTQTGGPMPGQTLSAVSTGVQVAF